MPGATRQQRTPPPPTLAGARVVLYAFLDERQQSMGYGRLAKGGGAPVQPVRMAITRYPGERSVYLLYCDEGWSVLAECWHPRLEDAQGQAEREYAGLRSTWEEPQER